MHAAELTDGTPVVVKAQRQGAADQVDLDLEILRRLARGLERSAPWARQLGVMGLVEGFADSLHEELDYGVELDNMAALRPSSQRGITIPEVFDELSTPRLIVMERLTGTPIAQASDLIAGLDADARTAAAQKLLAAVLGQLLGDGIFHADLHPGNVVVWEDGRMGCSTSARSDASTRRRGRPWRCCCGPSTPTTRCSPPTACSNCWIAPTGSTSAACSASWACSSPATAAAWAAAAA